MTKASIPPTPYVQYLGSFERAGAYVLAPHRAQLIGRAFGAARVLRSEKDPKTPQRIAARGINVQNLGKPFIKDD